MTIAIEKNVPLPAEGGTAETVVPELAKMVPGDSIYLPNKRGSGYPVISAVRVSLYGTRSGKRFHCQYDDDGMRVWRVE